MITLIQIDKSGSNISERDYSIVIAKNKEKAYGVNIPQNLKNEIFNSIEEFNISNKKRLILRFHTAIIIIIIKESTKTNEKLSIEICNDFDGHFHEIQNMILDNLKREDYNLSKEDIVQAKFNKPSFIDNSAKRFRKKITHNEDVHIKINLDELKKIIKKK